MTLEEKAREYALSALDEQINLIEKAYIDGYNAARYSVNIDGVEYIDMSLPSGTLWSMPLRDKDQNLIKMTYNDANSLSIPTLEEWEEFVANTKFSGGIQFLSINGKKYWGDDFWIKEEPDSNHQCWVSAIRNFRTPVRILCFMGEEKNVVLVKRKD